MNYSIDEEFIKKYSTLKISEEFVEKHPKIIANVSDVVVPPHIYRMMPKYAKKVQNNHVEAWVELWGYHSDPYMSEEEEVYQYLRILKNLIDVHPELVGLLKISDDSGNMVDYVPEKLFKFDEDFIKKNIEEILWVEDYIPLILIIMMNQDYLKMDGQ